jgi:hypothetical protein
MAEARKAVTASNADGNAVASSDGSAASALVSGYSGEGVLDTF